MVAITDVFVVVVDDDFDNDDGGNGNGGGGGGGANATVIDGHLKNLFRFCLFYSFSSHLKFK